MTRAYDNAVDARYPSGRRNLIINGNFDVWQRDTSGSLNAFVADRWSGGSGAAGTQSQQSFTAGQTDVPGEPTYFFRYNKTDTADWAALQQKIEDVRTGAGQTVTLSFWAKADASVTSSVQFIQNFGSGGSSQLLGTLQNFVVTTSWQKFTLTFAIPSISGKTIGAGSSLAVFFSPDNRGDAPSASWTGTWDLAQVQVELGNVATPFEHRSYGEELLACCRYYWKVTQPQTSNNESICMGTYYSGTQLNGHTPFKVPMRTSPTLVVSNGSGHFIAFRNAGSDAFDTFNPGETTENGGDFSINSGVSGTAGHGATICTASSSASFAWNAEL